MTALLAVAGARVAFGGVKAVDGVDLALERGRLHGLVGPNGSGKTTLVNALSGMVGLTAGTIAFKGADVTGLAPHELSRRGIARTFQGIRLISTLSVRENVMLGADQILPGRRWWRGARQGRVAAAADDALERLGLSALAAARPASLSYGTQRRVEIARALAGGPEVLLLDEPVAGMNREEREEIAGVLRALRADGLTQLLIEHDLGLIMKLCDHLTVMNFGRTVASGPPLEAAAQPEVQAAYLGKKHAVA